MLQHECRIDVTLYEIAIQQHKMANALHQILINGHTL